MTYQIIDQRDDVKLTSENLAEIMQAIVANDQVDQLSIGQTVSTYAFTSDGGQRGQLTVWHDQQRGAVALGGDSDWGDWDHDANALRVTGPGDTHVWYVGNDQVWEEADTESEDDE